MNKLKNTALIFATTFVGGLMFPQAAFAQEITFLPKDLQDIVGQDPIIYVSSRVKSLLTIALGGVVLISLIFSIIAAVKYITAQGNEQKIEEAKKSFTSIMVGVAALILSIIGVVLVLRFFGIDSSTTLCKPCVENPDAPACIVYYDEGGACPTL